jgi:hypothetical protein
MPATVEIIFASTTFVNLATIVLLATAALVDFAAIVEFSVPVAPTITAIPIAFTHAASAITCVLAAVANVAIATLVKRSTFRD